MDYNKLALLYGRFTIGNCHHRGISADEQDAIHQKMPDKRDSFLSSGISDGSPLGVRTQDPNIKSVVLYQLS